jgi:hypothetical protein
MVGARRPGDACPMANGEISGTFRSAKMLVMGYLGLSVATLVAIVLMRDNSSMVNDAVWVRVTIVVLSAILTCLFAFSAARGSRRAYLRLRIVTAVMVVAIAVIVALPGPFPVWLKVEQSVCGVLLLAVVLIVNSRQVRSQFAVRG